MPAPELAYRLDAALAREASGERILWRGSQVARIDPRLFGIYLFAVPWTAFALFWTVMAAAGTRAFEGAGLLAWAFPLFGVPFIVVGFAMLAAPFLAFLGGRGTLYAVTERRLLKLSLGRSLKVESIPGQRLGRSTRRERADGSGTLSFAVGAGTDSDGDRTAERFEMVEIANVFEAAGHVERMRAGLAALPPR